MQRFLPPAAPAVPRFLPATPTTSQLHAAESLLFLKSGAGPDLTPLLPYVGSVPPLFLPPMSVAVHNGLFDAPPMFSAGFNPMFLPPLFPMPPV